MAVTETIRRNEGDLLVVASEDEPGAVTTEGLSKPDHDQRSVEPTRHRCRHPVYML